MLLLMKNGLKNVKSISFCFIITLFACVNSSQEIEKYSANERVAFKTTVNTIMQYSEKGKMSFKLKAPLMEYYEIDKENNEIECPQGMEVFIFNEQQEVTTTMQSDYALMEDLKK
ncbi:MAG: LPS export ABC transporter periplasmic protein LptC, partial [Bacteroidota bacterium]